jgi:hypothetical protein
MPPKINKGGIMKVEKIEKIFEKFENIRKNHRSYKESRYDRKEAYIELIKYIMDKEEVPEAELMVRAKNMGLGQLYYNTFISIMRSHLGYIEYGKDADRYKTVKITNELREALENGNNDNEVRDEWEELLT